MSINWDDVKTDLILVTDNGYAVRTPINQFRISKRDSVGVYAIHLTKKSGSLVGCKRVNSDDDIIVVTRFGKLIRISVKELRIVKRDRKGVKIVALEKNDKVVDVR